MPISQPAASAVAVNRMLLGTPFGSSVIHIEVASRYWKRLAPSLLRYIRLLGPSFSSTHTSPVGIVPLIRNDVLFASLVTRGLVIGPVRLIVVCASKLP